MSIIGKEVIFFVTSLTAGGAERVMHSFIVKSLPDLSPCAVICLKWTSDRRLKDKLQELAPVIELIGDPVSGRLSQFIKALRVCWLKRSATFQGWMYHGCMLAVLFKLLVASRSGLCWAIHSSGILRNRNKVFQSVELLGMGAVCRLFGATVIYCGENSEFTHVRRWCWPRGQGKVIKNGINTERFAPSEAICARVRGELGIPDGALVLGYVGRWHPDKDVETLCQALSLIQTKLDRLVVVFCGNGLDRKNETFSRAISSANGITSICLGEVADTSQLIPAFDFLCLSSLREAFPLVLCEALACGVPCIATDVGDCRSIINGFGRVVPPGDPKLFAEAITEYGKFLRSKDGSKVKMAARTWATEALDEQKAVRHYVALLNAIKP